VRSLLIVGVSVVVAMSTLTPKALEIPALRYSAIVSNELVNNASFAVVAALKLLSNTTFSSAVAMLNPS
jgi:hypothetical protein